MKVQFSRRFDYVPEWNGNRQLPKKDQITAILTPLQMADLIRLMDTMEGITGGQTGEIEIETNRAVKMLKEVEGIQDNIEISGLEDETGPVTSEDMIKYPWYLNLTMELFNKLAEISMPTEEDEKN